MTPSQASVGSPPLQLYSEEQLLLPETSERRERMPGIVTDLLDAEGVDARKRLVRGMLHAIGFEWLGYGTFSQVRGQAQPLSFFASYAEPDWLQRYFSERYYEVDTRHQAAPASSLPLLWDATQLDAQADQDLTTHRRRFLDDFRASGIRSGLFLRLASPLQANERTVISLMSALPTRRWITDGVIGQALMLSLSLHEYLSRHARLPVATVTARCEMSTTQQHVLQHLLHGRSDKEIAYRLQLSAHTIDYHMRQLRRRFAARNRVQLVKAAMQCQHGDVASGAFDEGR